LAMFMIGLTLYTGLSWIWITDSIGKFVLRFSVQCRIYLSSFLDYIEGRRARKGRETALKIEQEIIEQRDPPKIEPVISDIEPSVRSIKEKQENLFETTAEIALPPLNLLDDPAP